MPLYTRDRNGTVHAAADQIVWAGDTNLYRSAADTLKTDDSLVVGAVLTVLGAAAFTGAVTGLTKATVGLGNVDNTADSAKPVSTAQATALALKVAKAGDTMTGLLALAAGAAGVGGLTIGGDVNLYRQAADILRTDDALYAGGLIRALAGSIDAGDGATNTLSSLSLRAGTGGVSQIQWFQAGTQLWLDYVPTGAATRYLRDAVNAKMHVTYVPGAGAGGGSTDFNSAVTVAGVFKPGRFTTALRPAAATAGQGGEIYDTTLSKPIWSDGTVWRDAAGTSV